MNNNKSEIKKVKEYGISAIIADLNTIAKAKGNVTDKESLKDNLLIIKDTLKREMLSSKVFVVEIEDPEKVDNFPADKPITICLNPYYELAMIKNLKPFPVDMDNNEYKKWLSNFEYYLAMHMLYFKEFGNVLNNSKDANYTSREIFEAEDIIIEYYDIENPKTNPLEKAGNILYYYPKTKLLEEAEKNVADYEEALTKKALVTSDSIEKIAEITGFKDDKIKSILSSISKIDGDEFKYKAAMLIK